MLNSSAPSCWEWLLKWNCFLRLLVLIPGSFCYGEEDASVDNSDAGKKENSWTSGPYVIRETITIKIGSKPDSIRSFTWQEGLMISLSFKCQGHRERCCISVVLCLSPADVLSSGGMSGKLKSESRNRTERNTRDRTEHIFRERLRLDIDSRGQKWYFVLKLLLFWANVQYCWIQPSYTRNKIKNSCFLAALPVLFRLLHIQCM